MRRDKPDCLPDDSGDLPLGSLVGRRLCSRASRTQVGTNAGRWPHTSRWGSGSIPSHLHHHCGSQQGTRFPLLDHTCACIHACVHTHTHRALQDMVSLSVPLFGMARVSGHCVHSASHMPEKLLWVYIVGHLYSVYPCLLPHKWVETRFF